MLLPVMASKQHAIRVSLWVPLDVTVDAAWSDLREMERVVLFLQQSKSLALDGAPTGRVSEAVWTVLESGAFIGEAAADDVVTFPLMAEGSRRQLDVMDGIPLQSLRDASTNGTAASDSPPSPDVDGSNSTETTALLAGGDAEGDEQMGPAGAEVAEQDDRVTGVEVAAGR